MGFVGGFRQKSSLSRRDEVVINRPRIGHIRFCYYMQTQTSLGARLVSANSLSSTCLLNVLTSAVLQRIFRRFLHGRNYVTPVRFKQLQEAQLMLTTGSTRL